MPAPDPFCPGAAGRGDAEIEEGLERLQPALRAYVGSLVGSSAPVDDIVQEANLLVWNRRANYEPGTKFNTWVLRIAYFKTLAYRRDAARRRKFVFNDELILQLAADGQELFERAGDERAEALAACVAELPDEQRALVEEHYFDGVSLTDIAKRTGRKPASLHKAISRVRLALRRCVHRRISNP